MMAVWDGIGSIETGEEICPDGIFYQNSAPKAGILIIFVAVNRNACSSSLRANSFLGYGAWEGALRQCRCKRMVPGDFDGTDSWKQNRFVKLWKQ